jgi:hypothetical protein
MGITANIYKKGGTPAWPSMQRIRLKIIKASTIDKGDPATAKIYGGQLSLFDVRSSKVEAIRTFL